MRKKKIAALSLLSMISDGDAINPNHPCITPVLNELIRRGYVVDNGHSAGVVNRFSVTNEGRSYYAELRRPNWTKVLAIVAVLSLIIAAISLLC